MFNIVTMCALVYVTHMPQEISEKMPLDLQTN